MFVWCSIIISLDAGLSHEAIEISLNMFQFMSIWVICTPMGYAYALYAQKLVSEDEIEQLKLDSLRSQYEALTNQVNPHFFFNSPDNGSKFLSETINR